MDSWVIWLIFAVALVIVELLTQWVSTFCLAIGCVASLIINLCGGNVVWQLVGLGLGTLCGFIGFIPFFKKRALRMALRNSQHASNMDALIGRIGIVIVDIPAHGIGRVKIDGDNWQAECRNHNIKVGEKVSVSGYESIILKVEPVEK